MATSHLLKAYGLVAASAVMLASLTPAQADVRYTTQMTMGDSTKTDSGRPASPYSPAFRTTTSIKDTNERVEQSMDMGPFHQSSVTLTLCDKQQTIKLDPDLKIYTVAPIGVMKFEAPDMRHGPRGGQSEGKPGVGQVVTTFTVTDMGTEKITDLMTHHAMITIENQSSGCIGDSDTTMKMETWTAPIKTLACPERFPTEARTIPNENGCQISYVMKGDVSQLRDAFGGMIVREKMYDKNGKVIMTQDLREYSTAALDDSLFAVPSDYKEVSASDFSKQEQQAMMNRMMHGGRPDSDSSAPQVPSSDQTPSPPSSDQTPQPHIHINLPKLPF